MTSLLTTTTKSAVHSIFGLVDDLVGGVTSVVDDIKKAFGGGGGSSSSSSSSASSSSSSANANNATSAPVLVLASSAPPAPPPSKRINLLMSSSTGSASTQSVDLLHKAVARPNVPLTALATPKQQQAPGTSVATLAAQNASTTLLRMMADAGSARDPDAALGLLAAGDQLSSAVKLTPAGGIALLDLFK
jgi:hypothetical protein